MSSKHDFNVLTLAERIPDEAVAYRFMESSRLADKPLKPGPRRVSAGQRGC
jgi:hypothetical protein